MLLWETGDIEASKHDINKEMNEVFFLWMAEQEEVYIMVWNKYYLTVTIMCIITQIASIVMRGTPAIE